MHVVVQSARCNASGRQRACRERNSGDDEQGADQRERIDGADAEYHAAADVGGRGELSGLEELRTYRRKSGEVSIGGDELSHTVLDTRSDDLRVESEIAANLRRLANTAKGAHVTLTRQ